MINITASNLEMTIPNITGTVGEILDSYHVDRANKIIVLNGATVEPDTQMPEAEEGENIEIEVRSTAVKVFKQVGEFTEQEVQWTPEMTVQDALNIAMEQAGLAVNTDELTCMDYSQNPNVSYPAGLRTEKVKASAELHLITKDKYNNGR